MTSSISGYDPTKTGHLAGIILNTKQHPVRVVCYVNMEHGLPVINISHYAYNMIESYKICVRLSYYS